MEDFDRRFERTFAMVAFAGNRHLIDHMRRVITLLEIDVESAMLWGLVAHLSAAHALHPGALPEELLAPDGSILGEARPVRLADVVQVSGLPKETVRRKLEKLRGQGRLGRTEGGRWIALRGGVDERTYEFTRESVKRLLQTAHVIEDILRHARLD